MLTVNLLLAIGAFVCTLAAALNRCPLWAPVLLLCVLALLAAVPH